MDVKFMIAVTEASEAAKEKFTLVAKVKAAMEITKNHWMLTDEDLRFKAAIAGAIDASSSQEDSDILLNEMKALSLLSDFLTDKKADMSGIKVPKQTIGLMKIWIGIKEGGRK
jgi:hypothetical protein